MFKVESLSSRIGKIQILHSLDFHVDKGEIVSIIGANGAGKSTLLNTLAGIYTPVEGKVTLYDDVISGLPTHKIVGKGLCLVPEGRQIFPGHTVKENLLLGIYSKYYKDRKHVEGKLEKMMELFPALRKHYNSIGGNLSGGEQQMLAIGRALMSDPKIILLDEPSMGLAPKIVNEILDILVLIKEEMDTMVILVEQNVKAALKVADRVYVMDQGRFIMKGTNEEISSNSEVKSAYLGMKVG